jgi:hypothetical protein
VQSTSNAAAAMKRQAEKLARQVARFRLP